MLQRDNFPNEFHSPANSTSVDILAVLVVLALSAEHSLDENSISPLMKNNKQTNLSYLVWESSPEINWIEGSFPIKDDATLPDSVTEDIGGYSLCPIYSTNQLRRMDRLERIPIRLSQIKTKAKLALELKKIKDE